ncbi:hypothetical protein [Leptolyngbya sp. 7M]|uniref:Uncharacterized protein n=1 Tax=Leptolyngbya sp. NK1-12 TaxID=2547451 RepID=A0AA96WL08_9CYAN|nr:hypothetical protein [Leptolyngbya sp. 7M]MBF2050196.1 hypothetical protein [Elainella sp. C42_A2020_010]QYO63471.1 hypothetical protein JVX88_26785 [Leptolyngbya sp. 7M]WNZ27548.1 hypothetical protein HJG54_32260 [Leptolyngbya sp. NK1-12]
MLATLAEPRFRQAQKVSFLGGEGVIQSYRPSNGTWTYLVEMFKGPEPAFGRLGQETMVLLYETELNG